MPGRDLCLLSLDGGGIRGLATLQILKQLMESVGKVAGLESPPRPCDYFDMIGGTSTGGLIAIMLGRLKMDIDTCIESYIEMSDKIFQKKHHRVNTWNGQVQGRFDSAELENAIKRIIKEQGHDENILLKDEADAVCKVFVCATSKITSDTVHLTSYSRARGGSERLRVTRIWEAARATSAASSFFDPIRINIGQVGEEFVDGATGANNPVQELWNEAKDYWDPEPLENNLKCIVSIGTGVPSVEPFKTGLLDIGQTLVRISTETEKTAESFQRSHSDLDDSSRYFRFNVSHGLEKIGLEDSSQKDVIVAVTQRYVESQNTFKQMKRCALNLGEKECVDSALVVRNKRAIKEYRSQANQALTREAENEDTLALLERLSSYDFEGTHRRLSRKRLKGTGRWFLEKIEFQNWLNGKGSPSLWCSGKIGSGKTMIATAAIEAAMDRSMQSGTAMIYFYCENERRDLLRGIDLLASFIKQLIVFLDKNGKPWPKQVYDGVVKFFGRKHSEPDFDDLNDIFSILFTHMMEATYIIDGLDEFDEREVEIVLHMVRRLFGNKSGNLGSRILIFSRDQVAPKLDVSRSVPDTVHFSISPNNIKIDIQQYIETKIQEKTDYGRELTQDADLMKETKEKLLEGALGMFLWVHLQVEALWAQCATDLDIRHALINLPEDLEETYRRCIDRINHNSRYAFKVLKWVNYAMRPLHIDELREAVAFDLQDRTWSQDKIPDSISVIGSCANLVVLDATDKCVRFAHSSIKHYLEERHSNRTIVYPTHSKQGDLDCGELCVSYLCFSNFGLQIAKQNPKTQPNFLPPDLMTKMIRHSFGSIASKLVKHNGSQIPFLPTMCKNLIPAPDPMQYRFLHYAVENWALQTKLINNHSVVWEKFLQLATNPNETWNFYPWFHGGRSRGSYLHGLLGWAVREHHIPLLRLVIELTDRNSFKDIFNLPLIHGSLPALHVASRRGFLDSVEQLLKVCKITARDGEGRTAFHHAAEKGHLDIIGLLLTIKGANPDSKSYLEETPLMLTLKNGQPESIALLFLKHRKLDMGRIFNSHRLLVEAARLGYNDVVKLLIKGGSHIDGGIQDEKSPLTCAAGAGQLSTTKLLIEEGASLNWKDDLDKTPLIWAAYNGHVKVTKLLLEKGAALDKRNHARQTSLMCAAMQGHEAVAKLLIENGAEIDDRDHNSHTSLMYAAIKGHEAVAKLLIENGAAIEDIDNDRHTALIYAAIEGHEAVARLLIENGAVLDSKDWKYGTTPLALAARNGHEAVAKLLIENGADLNFEDQQDRTPLALAAENGHEAVARLLIEEEAMRYDLKDRYLQTPLVIAAENGREAVTRLLIEHGAIADSKDLFGTTPLALAAKNGHVAVTKFLIGNGADLNFQDFEGTTSLIWTAIYGHEAVTKLLIEKGAALDVKDKFDKTALMYATEKGHQAVVNLLRSKIDSSP